MGISKEEEKKTINKEKTDKTNFRTSFRREIINKITAFIRLSGLPDHITAFLVRTVHINIPLYCIILVSLLPLQIAWIIVLIAIFILTSGIFFKGCILNGIEKQLCKDTPSCEEVTFYTVIDPIIILNGGKVNKKTRFNYSIVVVLCWFFSIISIFALRLLNIQFLFSFPKFNIRI